VGGRTLGRKRWREKVLIYYPLEECGEGVGGSPLDKHKKAIYFKSKHIDGEAKFEGGGRGNRKRVTPGSKDFGENFVMKERKLP